MAKRKSADYMKDLLDKLDDLNLGGSGFWTPPEGTTAIRILPEVGTMEYFFQEIGQHYDQNVYCPKLTKGDECPVCELSQTLYQAGDKDAASQYRPSHRFLLNIIVRSEEGVGPRIWSCPKTVFGTITALIKDPDYGFIFDVDEGLDLRVVRDGQGIDTKYNLLPTRYPTPLHEQDDVIDEWLEAAADLKAWAEGRMLEYDEIIEKAGIQAFYDMEEEQEEEPEGEESASDLIREKLANRNKRRSGRERRGRRG